MTKKPPRPSRARWMPAYEILQEQVLNVSIELSDSHPTRGFRDDAAPCSDPAMIPPPIKYALTFLVARFN